MSTLHSQRHWCELSSSMHVARFLNHLTGSQMVRKLTVQVKCVWSSGQFVSWLELQLLVTVYCSYSSTGWPKANQASQFKCQASKISSQYVLNSKLHQSIKSICIWFASRNHLICIRFWGAKLRRLKGLSLAEMGTFGKSATPCTILYIALSFICFLLSARVGRFRLLHNIE